MVYVKALCCYGNDTYFDCFRRFAPLSTVSISATWLEKVKLFKEQVLLGNERFLGHTRLLTQVLVYGSETRCEFFRHSKN